MDREAIVRRLLHILLVIVVMLAYGTYVEHEDADRNKKSALRTSLLSAI